MNLKYYFFGKNCKIDRNLSDHSNLKENLVHQGFKGENILLLNQIHSNKVITITKKSEIYGTQNLPKLDAIVTNLENITIGVVTADCAPILLSDIENNVIAAIHAGWRGAKLGIIENAIAAMRNIGAKNITANIGPMILQQSYEVSKDFLPDFCNENPQNKQFFKENLQKQGKYFFDLNAYVINKLKIAEISKINNLNIDSYSNDKDFFSFRRSTHLKEPDYGRNIALIELQS